MALKRVSQVHDQGCLYAGIATLLGISYSEAFRRIHPLDYISLLWDAPMLRADSIGQVLSALGIKYRISNARRVKSLRHNALLIIRWSSDPRYSHTLVWDAERKKLLDPGGNGLSFREVEAQLYRVLYIEGVS